MEIQRLFAGVAVRGTAELQGLLAELRRELAEERVRWVRPEKLHLTVEFFGSVEAGRLDELQQALAQAAGKAKAFDLRIGGLGLFGSRRHPRVLWLGVESAGLHRLHDQVAAALREAGWTPEARTYAPHLTLARFARVKDPRRIGEVVARRRDAAMEPQAVTELILYESADGRYVPLARWGLGRRDDSEASVQTSRHDFRHDFQRMDCSIG